jgi:four helix bundle protein
MYLYSFEKLEVWKLAKGLCIFIYPLTGNFPANEKFGLVSQMRRCAISIASNIAEGSSRISEKDQSHFYTIAYSGAIELLNQLIISTELNFILQEDLQNARIKIEQITKGISGLRKAALNPKL